mgnify:CR=1 FL=1
MVIQPTLEELIEQIFALNQAWKQASNVLFTTNAGLAISLKELKTTLQIRLLRSYPTQAYLQIDAETESEEPLYGVIISPPLGKYSNAAHLPVRVAQTRLTPTELTQLVRN